MAKLAYEAGYTPQQIAGRTIMPIGVVTTWSGERSKVWQRWIERFEEMVTHDDDTIRLIAQVGIEICTEQFEKDLKKEYDESVFGRED